MRKRNDAVVAPGAVPPFAFHVVGLGASAGGLAALEEFFDAVPAASGLAYIVVTHQPSGRVSLLPELLARHTKMPVELACDGMQISPDRVYVSPPGRHLALVDGMLETVEPKEGPAARLPIDFFFQSLAHDKRERAICVVLSGTGADGSLGLRAIKAEGGLSLVQDEESAEYSGMPLSALGTGLADYVLPPRQMPAQLALRLRTPPGDHPANEIADPGLEAALRRIFVLLRVRTGHDFSGYKVKTMRRRVERRMRARGLESPLDYVRLLEKSTQELDILFRELLIGVTSFFRDKEAFEALESILVKRLTMAPDHAALRIWVPGCSTGEEAYSIAILAAELTARTGRKGRTQIFATDLDAEAVETARAGIYAEGVALEVGPARLERWFTREDGDKRRVKSEIRETVVFAVQNIFQDPPFTKLDLISCRNLLIYLNAELQAQIMPMFHYALNPGGILMLGTSETTGGFDRLFATIDRRWRIYQRRATATPTLPIVRRSRASHGVPLRGAPPASNPRQGVGSAGVRNRARGLRGAAVAASKEALRSANEELQSANEELQSTNEELETSREELSSVNEELQTVNAEFLVKMDDLSRANDDMRNLLDSTDIATLFLDRELRIKRFTPKTREIICVIPSDVGRKLADLAANVRYDALAEDARRVLDTLAPHEVEVQMNDGKWRLLRISPYWTSENVLDGVVVTSVDVDRVKRAEILAASRAVSQSIVRTVREPLVVLDEDMRVVSANRAFGRLFSLPEGDLAGRSLFDIGRDFFSGAKLRALLDDVLVRGEAFEDLEVQHEFAGSGRRLILLNARRLESETGPTGHVLLALDDATGRRL